MGTERTIQMSEKFGIYEIHDKENCESPCPFHSPSEHPLNKAKIHLRDDKGFLVERICEHGVGHDDPDSVAYFHKHGQTWAGVHGCDGCCQNKITRVELIDHTAKGEGREFVRYYDRPVDIQTSVQDQGRTLKIFVSELQSVEQEQSQED